MKRLAAFSLILISSIFSGTFACGPYYPYGDDIRFVLFKPEIFNYSDFLNFSYSADLFYSAANNNLLLSSAKPIDDNILLWRKRCNYIPDPEDIYSAVYCSGDGLNDHKSTNTFIQYLHNKGDKEAIEYLIFAHKCSPFNTVIEDPWERNEYANVPQRTQLINEALTKAQTLTDKDLRLRYAFLAIRLAYYNNDGLSIKDIYDKYFSTRKTKGIIDYWGMYFMTFAEKDSIKRNFYASQVFSFAPDKRQNIIFYYDRSLKIEETLKYAKNSDEEAAIWMMAGFRKTGKGLDILKKLYSIKPRSRGLSFLLLREVNKLEDWIYTPYYTCFNPSLESNRYYDRDSYPANRIIDDRAYAQEVLDFVSSTDISKVENPTLWNLSKAYLYYMVQNYESSLNELSQLKGKGIKDQKISDQIGILTALCLTAKPGEKIIPEEAKPVIMREFAKANNKFVFAIARELEYKGNTTDAAILLSKLKENILEEVYYGSGRNGIYWKTKTNHHTLPVNYYYDYFFYLDAQYSVKQLSNLITEVENSRSKDKFDLWKYSVIRKDIPRLHDLAGTKSLRANDLKSALIELEKVSDTLWTSTHYHYCEYLDANPFYTNMYNEHEKTSADTVRYNKDEITARLIDYLSKADDITNKNRDYYYFLAANCYFNMTQYGNSWMMKRYFWTSNIHKTNLEDDDDYFNCTLARQYYLKAKEVSRSRMFAALCLRMAGRCENYRINNIKRENQSEQVTPENTFYRDLKSEFVSYYDDLMGNCESFESYFNSRQ